MLYFLKNPRSIMLLVWCGCMLLDYLSGSASAIRNGQWCSTSARQGLWHKGGMILVVTVAALCDLVLNYLTQLPQVSTLGLPAVWPGLLLPLVLSWYILTELGSVLENALQLGAPVPDWLRRLLRTSLNAVDAAGRSTAGQNDETVEKNEKNETNKEKDGR